MVCRYDLISLAASVLLYGVGDVAGQNLSSENAREISRVIAPSPEQAAKLSFRAASANLDLNILDDALKAVRLWHSFTLVALAVDHVPKLDPDGLQLNLKQFGPHRASYVTVLVHLAMYETARGFEQTPRFKSWIAEHLANPSADPLGKPSVGASEPAAIQEAAYVILRYLYPNLVNDLRQMRGSVKITGNTAAIESGRDWGRRVALAIIDIRSDDNANIPEPTAKDVLAKAFIGDPKARWSVDPVSQIAVALGGHWGQVKGFINDEGPIRKSVDSLKPPTSGSFLVALQEVMKDGEDQAHRIRYNDLTSEGRAKNQERLIFFASREHIYQYYQGKFWSYDGTPSLCAPVRLYNQIADSVLDDTGRGYQAKISQHYTSDKRLAATEVARYYSLVNLAMVEAGIRAWELKYKFQYWRPVTGVRRHLESASSPRPEWYPLGAQNTNSAVGYNVTPPFPAFPSGHAVFGSAFFEMLRHFVHNDTGFTLQSDELRFAPDKEPSKSVQNMDALNFIRCRDGDTNKFFCKGVTYRTFGEAERCNSLSRIWLGVHWKFDADDGERLGRVIGKAAWTELASVGGAASKEKDAETATCMVPAGFQPDPSDIRERP